MTHYVNLRGGDWGAVVSPYVLVGDPLAATPPTMASLDWNAVPLIARGRDVVLAAHGFNVSYQSGLVSLSRLEQALTLSPSQDLFLGVLWPGDWVIPAVNYPFEDGIASHAGRLLGAFCNQWLATARSLTFVSHSLGARVILEAIRVSARRVRRACITAGAVNSGCLNEQFVAAAANCDDIRSLSSLKDLVLEFAYPPGDFLADLLDPDHPPFEPAMGRGGPADPIGSNVRAYHIPNDQGFDHGDYFPPGAPDAPPPGPDAKWPHASGFISDVYRGRSPAWPPG